MRDPDIPVGDEVVAVNENGVPTTNQRPTMSDLALAGPDVKVNRQPIKDAVAKAAASI